MEKIYRIVKREGYHVHEYRFYSLYNGMRGVWHSTREAAIEEGEAHQKIILSLHAREMRNENQNL